MLLRIFASEKAAVTGGLSSRYQPTGSGTFQTSWERIQGGLDDSFRVRRRQHDLIYRWSAFDAKETSLPLWDILDSAIITG